MIGCVQSDSEAQPDHDRAIDVIETGARGLDRQMRQDGGPVKADKPTDRLHGHYVQSQGHCLFDWIFIAGISIPSTRVPFGVVVVVNSSVRWTQVQRRMQHRVHQIVQPEQRVEPGHGPDRPQRGIICTHTQHHEEEMLDERVDH